MRYAFCLLCYHLWLALPTRLSLHTAFGRWMMPYVGEHAYWDYDFGPAGDGTAPF